MPQRINYFDALRGLAIIAVVGIHSSGSGLDQNGGNLNFIFTVLWRNSLNFAVPMFLAISGYFLGGKEIGNFAAHANFLRKQLPRVYVPFLFWSIVWLCLSVIILKKPIGRELLKLGIFQSSGHYYFIALIMQLYILLPLLEKIPPKIGLMSSFTISNVMVLLIYFLRYHTQVDLPLIVYGGNFLTWIVFFFLGLNFKRLKSEIRIANKYLLVIMAMMYLGACFESFFLIEQFQQPKDAVTAVKVCSFLLSFVSIIFFFNNLDLIKSHLLVSLGRMSFGIYLIHGFFLIPSRKILDLNPALERVAPLYQLGLMGMTIIFCCIAILSSNNFFPRRINRWIGFS